MSSLVPFFTLTPVAFRRCIHGSAANVSLQVVGGPIIVLRNRCCEKRAAIIKSLGWLIRICQCSFIRSGSSFPFLLLVRIAYVFKRLVGGVNWYRRWQLLCRNVCCRATPPICQVLYQIREEICCRVLHCHVIRDGLRTPSWGAIWPTFEQTLVGQFNKPILRYNCS